MTPPMTLEETIEALSSVGLMRPSILAEQSAIHWLTTLKAQLEQIRKLREALSEAHRIGGMRAMFGDERDRIASLLKETEPSDA